MSLLIWSHKLLAIIKTHLASTVLEVQIFILVTNTGFYKFTKADWERYLTDIWGYFWKWEYLNSNVNLTFWTNPFCLTLAIPESRDLRHSQNGCSSGLPNHFSLPRENCASNTGTANLNMLHKETGKKYIKVIQILKMWKKSQTSFILAWKEQHH